MSHTSRHSWRVFKATIGVPEAALETLASRLMDRPGSDVLSRELERCCARTSRAGSMDQPGPDTPDQRTQHVRGIR